MQKTSRNHCPCCGGPRRKEANIVSLSTVWFTCEKCEFTWRSTFLEMAIGSALATVQRRPVSYTSKIVDVLMAEKTSHAPMTVERSDPEVSIGLNYLESALDASGPISDDAANLDDSDAVVAASLASWSSGSSGSSKSSGSSGPVESSVASGSIRAKNRTAEVSAPAGSFDDQLDGLDSGLAKPVGALLWHADAANPDAKPAMALEVKAAIGLAITIEDLVEADLAEEQIEEQIVEEVLVEEASPAWQLEDQTPSFAPPVLMPAVVPEKPFESPLTLSTDRMLKNVDSLCEAFQRIDRQLGSMDALCQQLMAP